MDGARMRDEVQPRPGIADEELAWKEVTFQPIASATGEDDVSRHVSAAVRQRIHVIQRREVELESRGAVHAAAAAVAHCGSLDRPLLVPGGNLFGPAWRSARDTRKGNTVNVPTS